MLRLEELRRNRNLSQLELARRMNMTQQRISAYEKGKREPDIETIKQFADFFGVSTDYLLGKSDERNPEEPSSDIDMAFYDGYKGLNDTNKEIAKNIIEGLKAKQNAEKRNNK